MVGRQEGQDDDDDKTKSLLEVRAREVSGLQGSKSRGHITASLTAVD